MDKLGTKEHLYDVYYRGRNYIIEEKVKENAWVGLSLLCKFLISNWELIEELMEEEDGE